MSEAFIYLWYVVATKMYYLGVHNGKDPYYTHSSSSSEEFRSIVPSSQAPIKERKEFWKKYHKGEIKGIRYRRLSKRFISNVPYLTEDLDEYGKMCEREHVLLVNRKNRCWNRYYNNSLGDPRYVDTSGKNNPMYKHGMTIGARDNPEIKAAYDKERGQWPEYRESERIRDRKRNATPERKAWRKRYDARKKSETQGTGNLKAFL